MARTMTRRQTVPTGTTGPAVYDLFGTAAPHRSQVHVARAPRPTLPDQMDPAFTGLLIGIDYRDGVAYTADVWTDHGARSVYATRLTVTGPPPARSRYDGAEFEDDEEPEAFEAPAPVEPAPVAAPAPISEVRLPARVVEYIGNGLDSGVRRDRQGRAYVPATAALRLRGDVEQMLAEVARTAGPNDIQALASSNAARQVLRTLDEIEGVNR